MTDKPKLNITKNIDSAAMVLLTSMLLGDLASQISIDQSLIDAIPNWAWFVLAIVAAALRFFYERAKAAEQPPSDQQPIEG